MKILFDLGGTVFGLIDMSLRPGIKETIEDLRGAGNTVDFWTFGRKEHYAALLDKTGISGAVYHKDTPLPYSPDVCVDDEPGRWMPARVVKVEAHVAEDLPAEDISAEMILKEAV